MARHDIARYISLEGVDPAKIDAINALKDGVHYRVGSCRKYRPMPPDFGEVYIRLGWGRAITEHYRASDKCIMRWIEECGGDELRAKRSAVTGFPFYPNRRSRYPTYEQVVAAILRGEDVPAIPRPVPKREPTRKNDALYVLALDRGYRVRPAGYSRASGARLYRLYTRMDRLAMSASPASDLMAWLEPQPPVQW